MDDTHSCDDNREIVAGRTASYVLVDDWWHVGHFDQNEGLGSSSLYSTLDDMFTWMQVCRSRRTGGDDAWDLVLAPGVLNSGEQTSDRSDLSLDHESALKSVAHGGSWAGFPSQVTYSPEHDFATILMINRDPSLTLIVDCLARIMIGVDEDVNRAFGRA